MSSRKRFLTILSVLSLLGALAGPAAGQSPRLPDSLGAFCATGGAGTTVADLLAPGAEVVAEVGDQALTLVPGVYPGIRERLVSPAEGIWCPASALNLVVDADSDAIELATLAATVLPAAHFDGVTVTDAVEVAPGEVHLTTHARTNGVVADWVVRTDATGVRSAEWTATDLGVAPFEAQIEGLTALPGATMGYERSADGSLQPTVDVLALARAEMAADPSPFISVEAEDGFTMHVVVGDGTFYPQAANSLAGTNLPRVYGGLGPDAGSDTGNEQVDYLRIMAEALEINYADFLDWGFEKGWVDDEGNLYVDGALSAYCLACVLVSEYFNINMSRAAHEAIAVLGYTYPDVRLALIDIIGHEMIHNIQNAYGKPDSTRGGRNNAFSEGTARFSETIHSYSEVSHQPNSLVYANDTNGCNGWQGNNADAAFAAGPLTGQSYDACYFWMTFYASYGIDAFAEVFRNTEGLESGRGWQIYDSAILAGARAVDPDATLQEVLANFAAMSLTGRDYRWGAATDPDAPVLDWAEFLDLWTPTATIDSGPASANLRDGGMAAFEVLGGGTVTSLSTDEGHAAVLVVDDGGSTTVEMLQVGSLVEVPAGQTGWLVLLNASTQTSTVTVDLAPSSLS